MKIKELVPFAQNLFNYQHETMRLCLIVDSLNAEAHNLAMQRKEKELEKNRKEYDRCWKEIDSLTVDRLFGKLYENASENDQYFLKKLLQAFDDHWENKQYTPLMTSFQMAEFLRYIGVTKFAEKECSMEDVQLIIDGGKYFISLIPENYDFEKNLFAGMPKMRDAKKFLKERGLV